MNETAPTTKVDSQHKANEKKTVSPKIEQRSEKRHTVDEWVSIAFYNGGALFRGSIMNLSSTGACLLSLIDGSEKTPDLYKGRTIECYILTRKGRSKCRGVVHWTGKESSYLMWGISFMELSSLQNDPLRILIEDVCNQEYCTPITASARY